MYIHLLKKLSIVSIILLSITYSCNTLPNNNEEILDVDRPDSIDLSHFDGNSYTINNIEDNQLEVINIMDIDSSKIKIEEK